MHTTCSKKDHTEDLPQHVKLRDRAKGCAELDGTCAALMLRIPSHIKIDWPFKLPVAAESRSNLA